MISLEPMKSETVPRPSEDGRPSPLTQAAEVALAYLRSTGQWRKNRSMEVFAELAQRTVERAPQGLTCEFTAQNLKEGVAPEVQKEPSGWLSPHWKQATEEEPQWQEGLVQHARVLGYAYTPKLTKVQGSPALYSLTPVAVTPAAAEESPLPAPCPGGIRYTPEVVAAPAAWLSATLKSGVVRWTGGVRWSMLGLILVGLLVAGFLVWASFNHGLRSTRPLSMRDFWSNALVVLAVIAVVRLYKFFDHLFDLGIIMAPSALTPMSADNVTLELRRHGAANTLGELAFVRYTGTCPRCDALVVIFSGEQEFKGRLIGRCRRSPREHVYSFDHVHRIGAPLR